MSVKVKGGMWCDSCQKPVAGQKSTRKAFQTMATVGTAGAYIPTPGEYHCPSCGGPVRPAPKVINDPGWTPGVVIGLIFVVLMLAGCGAKLIGSASGDSGAPTTTEACPSWNSQCPNYQP